MFILWLNVCPFLELLASFCVNLFNKNKSGSVTVISSISINNLRLLIVYMKMTGFIISFQDVAFTGQSEKGFLSCSQNHSFRCNVIYWCVLFHSTDCLLHFTANVVIISIVVDRAGDNVWQRKIYQRNCNLDFKLWYRLITNRNLYQKIYHT